MKRFLVLMCVLAALLSCSKSKNNDSPCNGIDCSGHGRCDDSSGHAVCVCEDDFVPVAFPPDCIEEDKVCADVECDDWEECLNGECRPKKGKCSKDGDCSGTQKCDTENHDCVAACDLIDCGGHGECSEGAAYGSGYGSGSSYQSGLHCNCEAGYIEKFEDDYPTCVSEDGGDSAPDGDTGGDTGEEGPCNGVNCGGYGKCVAEDGEPKCDCYDGYIEDGLNCVPDPCSGVECEEWEVCSEGNCQLDEGRCVGTSDCGGGEACDILEHTCQTDFCATVNCGNGGVCTVENGSAVCNCPHGFYESNSACVPITSLEPGWVGVQWPFTITKMKDEASDKVYGQIWVDGQTGSGVPQHTEWKAQLLYKKGTGSAEYPVIAGTWNKVDAVFNAEHSGDNNHEYMADFPTDKAGDFIYIFRFSLDGGTSWWYGDKGVGENMEPGPKFITSSDNHPGKATVNEPPKVLLKLENYSRTADSLHFELVYQGTTPIDFAASKVTMNNEVQDASALYDEEQSRFVVNETSLSPNKYSWLFRLVDTTGSRIEPFFVPIWVGEGVDFADFGWRDAFVYQIMTDRFLDGDPSNNVPASEFPHVTEDLEKWKGGDFRGIIKKIEEGYFTDMGVNALWISSPILNPHRESKGGTASNQSEVYFTSYHAYHPVATGVNFEDDLGYDNEGIDTAFGTAAELHELVEKAHERGIRVIPDFAANHVHSDAKLYQLHKNDGWFYPQVACADGNNWEDHRIDCWFTPYMPDFNYGSNPDARKTVIDHAIWLIQNFNLDGFRADALKHMDDIFIIELRTAFKEKIETTVTDHDSPDEAEVFYTVGESLGGDWPRYHTRPNMVQGQVSDQYFYNVRDNIFNGGNYADLASRAINLDTTYQSVGGNGGGYPGAVMGNFFGNHDQDRALTFCNGDYNKLKHAQTLLLTSPINIPMLYQGDDIGMTGWAENGFDGGRRKVMKFTGLSGDEQAALSHVKKLGKFRKQHPALRHSTRTTCYSDSNVWLYKFEYNGDVVIAGLNKGGSAYTGSCGISGTFTSFDGSSVNVQNGQVTIPANGSLVIGK